MSTTTDKLRRASGQSLCAAVIVGMYWLLFGKFALDVVVIMIGGVAGLYLVFGIWFGDARPRNGKQVAAWVIGAFTVWSVSRWLLDNHFWRK